MKNKLFGTLALSLTLILAGLILPVQLEAQTDKTNTPNFKIEVVYFHAPNRCPSCVATETQTKQILEKHFKKEISSGVISFIPLDLKEEKNEALVEKYEVVFPTLLILKKKGSQEVKTDFSTTAFQYAYTEPEKYKKLLETEIEKMLVDK